MEGLGSSQMRRRIVRPYVAAPVALVAVLACVAWAVGGLRQGPQAHLSGAAEPRQSTGIVGTSTPDSSPGTASSPVTSTPGPTDNAQDSNSQPSTGQSRPGGNSGSSGQPAKPPAAPAIVRIGVAPDLTANDDRVILTLDGPAGVQVVVTVQLKWYYGDSLAGTSQYTFDGSGHLQASVSYRYPAASCGRHTVRLTASTRSNISLSTPNIMWLADTLCVDIVTGPPPALP